MAIEEDKVRIYFEHADQGLTSQGGEPTEFTVAGEDKIFHPAQARIDGSTVLVWHDNIKRPTAVRFGFDNAARPNLMTTDGLPVNLFRTDDWPIDTEAIKECTRPELWSRERIIELCRSGHRTRDETLNYEK
jgi:sialate O-acetylesterase